MPYDRNLYMMILLFLIFATRITHARTFGKCFPDWLIPFYNWSGLQRVSNVSIGNSMLHIIKVCLRHWSPLTLDQYTTKSLFPRHIYDFVWLLTYLKGICRAGVSIFKNTRQSMSIYKYHFMYLQKQSTAVHIKHTFVL